MKNKFSQLLISNAFVFAIILGSPIQAQNLNNFFNGLFNGGQRQTDRRVANEALRSANKEIQTALNYFGFDAGVVDGIVGARSRAAITAYQETLKFPVTGRLAKDEKEFLLSAFGQVTDGGAEMNWRILANSEGSVGILKSLYLEENPFADIVADQENTGQLSMRKICTEIGAFSQADLVTAQFCNLRRLAIDQSRFLVETVPNPRNLSAVIQQCETFFETMRPITVGLELISPDEASQKLIDWANNSNLPPEALTSIAETCIGASYLNDNSSMALAAVFAMAGLDQATYIELVGYHVAFGLGYEGSEDLDTANEWFNKSADLYVDQVNELTRQDGETRTEIVYAVIDILEQQD